MKRFFYFFLFLAIVASAQTRETRAVWVATNFRLDWPPPVYDETEQKLALEEIFEKIRKKNFNTVYFQTVVKATAFYNSKILPFSPYINGFDSAKSNYDPLSYAIFLARKYGLEIHAWINTARVFSGDEYQFLNLPEHITRTRPDWIVIYGRGRDASYWLDFGIPQAREFMIDVAREIAENYDIDGIQFDFLRYPGKNFADKKTFEQYGRDSLSLDDWRRENINAFIREAYDTLKAVNPLLKIGAAPFGIYKNISGAKGGESYSLVYQDSRKWLAEGKLDYLVPQIYWNINDNPRFDSLACDWVRHSFGRNIVLGAAAYKPEVLSEKEELIEIARKCAASGIAFFRYGFISQTDFPLFDKFVYPSEMPWLNSDKPEPPLDFRVVYSNDSFLLGWKKSRTPLKYYSLYDVTFEPKIIALFPANANSARMRITRPQAVINRYEIRAVGNLWNESEPSNSATVEVKKLAKLISPENSIPLKPFLFKKGKNFYLVIRSESCDNPVELISGEKRQKTDLKQGINILKVGVAVNHNLILNFPSLNKKIRMEIK